MRLRFAWTYAILLPVLSHGLYAQDNLALQATAVEASDESPNHGPRQAVDGSVKSYWEVAGSNSRPAWVEISWKDAITIRELVLRRYDAERGMSDLTHLKVEGFQNGAWRELLQVGDWKTPLPKLIYQRIAEQTTQKLRISGFDAKALIREIEVYSKSTPSWMDIRGDARGNMIGVLTDGSGSAGMLPRYKSPGTRAENSGRQPLRQDPTAISPQPCQPAWLDLSNSRQT